MVAHTGYLIFSRSVVEDAVELDQANRISDEYHGESAQE
jgi:hypothetical protein